LSGRFHQARLMPNKDAPLAAAPRLNDCLEWAMPTINSRLHDFKRVTGKEPRSFRQFATDFAGAFGKA
jgi:hypothetical protein